MTRNSRLWLLLSVALAIRLLAAACFAATTTWEQHFFGDELGQIALNIVEGRGFSSPFGRGATPTAWLAPLVPYFWAVVFRLFGPVSQASLWLIMFTNALLSTAAWVTYCLILRRLWPADPRTEKLFVATCVLLIFWPASLAAVGQTWYFAWQEFATAMIVWLLVSWSSGNQDLRYGVWLGIASILLAYVNPLPLILLGGAAVYDLSGGRGNVLRSMPATWIAIVILALGMIPWTVRNWEQLGGLVLMRSNFGVELRQGNNEAGAIRQTAQSVHPLIMPQERVRFRDMGEYQYGRWAMSQALTYMRQHPAVTLTRIVQRAYVFWCSDIFEQWTWEPATKWWRRGTLAVLASLGRIVVHNLPWLVAAAVCLLGWARRVRARWVFASIALLFPLPYYLTHVSPRYSYVVQPYLLIFSALALASNWDSVVAWSGRRLARNSQPSSSSPG